MKSSLLTLIKVAFGDTSHVHLSSLKCGSHTLKCSCTITFLVLSKPWVCFLRFSELSHGNDWLQITSNMNKKRKSFIKTSPITHVEVQHAYRNPMSSILITRSGSFFSLHKLFTSTRRSAVNDKSEQTKHRKHYAIREYSVYQIQNTFTSLDLSIQTLKFNVKFWIFWYTYGKSVQVRWLKSHVLY